MSDKMRLTGMISLMRRIFDEYRTQKSIFDVPEENWYRKKDGRKISILGDNCDTVLGPAAGPHTQLAQNIIVSYLTGSRFIELKTVQILDALEIEKPCIDIYDEGYNTEWSTELSLEEAWREYARAWIALHLLEELFDMKPADETRSFIFNMSVGYDLKGIQTDRMQQYLARMKDCSGEPLFRQWIKECATELPAMLKGTGLEHKADRIPQALERVSGTICKSVTLSTMHGCPPNEIEAICRYMLSEQHLDTYVKLNPTLLGFDTVRKILHGLGFEYVELSREGFEHDLQYPDALKILTSLRQTAKENHLSFGVKLTNTLAVVNNRDALPDKEMYLSGRALFPLSIGIAARLSEHFQGDLPISFSGGISLHNVEAVFKTGIRPITMATDLLKPGGYLRQKQMAEVLDKLDKWDYSKIDVKALSKLANDCLSDETLTKDYRGEDEATIEGDMPMFDCYEAPCVTACAIRQHIPEYIRLVGEGRYGEALECIYERNALPSITGHICDHKCQLACTRLDYEGCINIREVKKIAVLNGMDDYRAKWSKPKVTRARKAAVVGAGPAGLSAAYFLAREGFSVTVFEREPDAGGVVRYIIPHFRISREAIDSDINFIKEQGVEFVFNAPENIDISSLKAKGFHYILLGLGTYQTGLLNIDGGNENIHASLPFLLQFNQDPSKLSMGKHVVVIGAGDTAMDCARSALRCPGTEKATIVYRRAFRQMPASRGEYEHALEDNVGFYWLRNPEKFSKDGILTLRVMELGEKDSSGRRRPVPTDKIETMKVDSIVYAIGDKPDAKMLQSIGLKPDADSFVKTRTGGETDLDNVFLIGDIRTGTSTIVRCIEEGRKAADTICRREDSNWIRHDQQNYFSPAEQQAQIFAKKGELLAKPSARTEYKTKQFAQTELSRCLECNYVCNKCVDVCPNRANIAVPVKGEALFSNPFEIVHLDAYCNECDDCGRYCPWKGKLPYKDKPTVFSSKIDFDNSTNPGWLLDGSTLHVRYQGRVSTNPKPNGDKNFEAFMRLYTILKETRPELFAPLNTEGLAV
ncbi:MAG: putative selenate reductase subunit YgfK [Spirochaeta sp. LUC14_002_19_P3]|nr:MAG: putative selenate reductase subunit YgfK [Spirochaeta sp. LUC14_002_19_P3]